MHAWICKLCYVATEMLIHMWSSVATPVDWKSGDQCMVVPSISDDAAKEKFGSFDVAEVPSGKRYIRMTVSGSICSCLNHQQTITFQTHFESMIRTILVWNCMTEGLFCALQADPSKTWVRDSNTGCMVVNWSYYRKCESPDCKDDYLK